MPRNKDLWSIASDLLGAQELSRRFRNWIGNLIRSERAKENKSQNSSLFDQDVASIIADLNERSKKRFLPTETASNAIIRLIRSGYTVQDFCRVHEAMVRLWLHDEKMNRYLRPSTLYRPSNFDEYLGEWWALESARQELQKKRDAANKRATPTSRKADASLVANLLSIPWHAHATWADFVRHTLQFPSAEALAKYDMPERLRKNRTEKQMTLKVISGKSPEWAEADFQQAKKEMADDKT
ncbi:MAG: conserved phage C-terminal domain-containing protein [Candidatus Cloacimonetes bacterium]|nr:conserved phage C-terminal domain-containing protein [Candidatus Cloacimonadota bacterium]